MGKFKVVSQDKKVPTQENIKSFVKKRKKRSNKRLLNSTHKNDLKTLNASNEVTNSTFTRTKSDKNKKRQASRNEFIAEKIQRYPKNEKRAKISQKVQSNNKIKCKKGNGTERKQKQNLNPDCTNPVTEANASVVKKNKALQMYEKKSINFDNQVKIQNIKTNKKKVKPISTKTEAQQNKPARILQVNKHKLNINRLKEILKGESQTKQLVQTLTLRDKMMAQLRASRFRFINETLYNNESSQSRRYFIEDPDAFKAYHNGYKQQLEQWPMNPLNIVISSIKKMPTDNIIADFGCGEARLADSVPHKVYSFDLIALNDRVKACDMAHTPLLTSSVHVVIFCLSLMGSNLNDYIIEANRVLKNNGILKIVEVESRFENVKDFMKMLDKYGFKNTWKDLSHNLFYFMDFKKTEDISMKRKGLPPITLKSCLYKKR